MGGRGDACATLTLYVVYALINLLIRQFTHTPLFLVSGPLLDIKLYWGTGPPITQITQFFFEYLLYLQNVL